MYTKCEYILEKSILEIKIQKLIYLLTHKQFITYCLQFNK